MIFNLIKSQTLEDLSNFKGFQRVTNGLITIRHHSESTDIYNQEKGKLKANDIAKYFNCENCGRNISGGRFAQHINKCLERNK